MQEKLENVSYSNRRFESWKRVVKMKLEVLTRKSELTLGIEARAKDRISTPCYSSSWVKLFNLGG